MEVTTASVSFHTSGLYHLYHASSQSTVFEYSKVFFFRIMPQVFLYYLLDRYLDQCPLQGQRGGGAPPGWCNWPLARLGQQDRWTGRCCQSAPPSAFIACPHRWEKRGKRVVCLQHWLLGIMHSVVYNALLPFDFIYQRCLSTPAGTYRRGKLVRTQSETETKIGESLIAINTDRQLDTAGKCPIDICHR